MDQNFWGTSYGLNSPFYAASLQKPLVLIAHLHFPANQPYFSSTERDGVRHFGQVRIPVYRPRWECGALPFSFQSWSVRLGNGATACNDETAWSMFVSLIPVKIDEYYWMLTNLTIDRSNFSIKSPNLWIFWRGFHSENLSSTSSETEPNCWGPTNSRPEATLCYQ